MSLNPFPTAPEIRLRQGRLAQSIGSALRGEILGLLSGLAPDSEVHNKNTLPKQQADSPTARYSVTEAKERSPLTTKGLI